MTFRRVILDGKGFDDLEVSTQRSKIHSISLFVFAHFVATGYRIESLAAEATAIEEEEV